jgi:hypothetical protein
MKILTENTFMVFDQFHEEIINPGDNGNSTPGFRLSRQEGHTVRSYRELLEKIAQLSYYNSRYRLLFRGQDKDYRTNTENLKSNLFPSIFRTKTGKFDKARKHEITKKFKLLRKAEALLGKTLAIEELNNNQLVSYAILQHYEICNTPFLDVTSSLHTALSFAIGEGDTGYLYVLAFPQLTGPVSVSIASATVIIDLAQIMAPEVLRPHFQNAMLAGDFPVITSVRHSHGKNAMLGNNFSARLLTKFKLVNCRQWREEGFIPTAKSILFPDDIDICYRLLKEMKEKL